MDAIALTKVLADARHLIRMFVVESEERLVAGTGLSETAIADAKRVAADLERAMVEGMEPPPMPFGLYQALRAYINERIRRAENMGEAGHLAANPFRANLEWFDRWYNRQAPIPMVLFCPSCGRQHVDAPNEAEGWTNPPHRSHLCHSCGHVWRPADVATTGVSAHDLRTKGKADTSTLPDKHVPIEYRVRAVTYQRNFSGQALEDLLVERLRADPDMAVRVVERLKIAGAWIVGPASDEERTSARRYDLLTGEVLSWLDRKDDGRWYDADEKIHPEGWDTLEAAQAFDTKRLHNLGFACCTGSST